MRDVDKEALQSKLDQSVLMAAPNPLLIHKALYELLSSYGMDVSGCRVIGMLPVCEGE